VKANGTLSPEPWRANPDAKVDCFYVYPTVSMDESPNSDMQPGDEERAVTRSQAARFGSECRLYVPLYRQMTLAALRAMTKGQPMEADRALGYGDVAAAFRHYLEHDNAGRGVVLIGHSQGASMLVQLLQKEIDGKPLQKQLISALLIGTSVSVPKGKYVGGSFKHIPLCRSADQLGCVVSYASFRANVPPPGNSRFGKSKDPKSVVACTNPAALGTADSGELHAYLPNGRLQGGKEPPSWVTPPKPIDSPFVSVPGLLHAKCVQSAQGSYLAVTVRSNSTDPRTDEIAGDVLSEGKLQADWGLHLIDMHLAMGNLVSLVRTQAKSYLARAAR
jgi:hypothetical protein